MTNGTVMLPYFDRNRLSMAMDSPHLSVMSVERRMKPSGAIQWVIWVYSDRSCRSYMVSCSEARATCTCNSFARNGSDHPCKHMYFVSHCVGRMKQSSNAWSWVVSTDQVERRRGFAALDRRWVSRLEHHGMNLFKAAAACPVEEPACAASDEPVCTVCMGSVSRTKSTCCTCQSCKGKFHTGCLFPWLVSNATCPNCRGDMHLTNLYDSKKVRHPLRHLKTFWWSDIHPIRGCRVTPFMHKTLCNKIRSLLLKRQTRRFARLRVSRSMSKYALRYLNEVVFNRSGTVPCPLRRISETTFLIDKARAVPMATPWCSASSTL